MPYHIKHAYLPLNVINRIDNKWHKLQSKRPLSSTVLNKLKERFMLEMTYNSNAIEGNNLTYKETYLIINEGFTIKGKSFKNHLEAKSNHDALEFIYDLIDFNSKIVVSEYLIRQVQSLVVSPIDKKIAGKYRDGDIAITGSKHKPPLATEISSEMKKLMLWYRKNLKELHPIEVASILHHKLVSIHPFEDGNGRTARLIANIVLLQARFPLLIILKNDRKKYYETLSKADDDNLLPFIEFIAQSVERSLNIYLETIVGIKSDSEKYLPLSELSDKTGLNPKHLNLLARSGKLSAHKVGRNWVSTITSVNDYLATKKTVISTTTTFSD